MNYLKMANWEKFQHYKDRSPPWIKLHTQLLHDYDFSCLQDANKLLLILLWVLASKLDNKIPHDTIWLKKQLGIKALNIQPLIEAGFVQLIQDASGVLADHKQSASLETEGETETKKRESLLVGEKGTPKKKPKEPPGFTQFWKAWPNRPPGRKSDKQDCLKKWISRNLEEQAETILRALEYCKGSKEWLEKGGKYIPGPAPWLKKEPWPEIQNLIDAKKPAKDPRVAEAAKKIAEASHANPQEQKDRLEFMRIPLTKRRQLQKALGQERGYATEDDLFQWWRQQKGKTDG